MRPPQYLYVAPLISIIDSIRYFDCLCVHLFCWACIFSCCCRIVLTIVLSLDQDKNKRRSIKAKAGWYKKQLMGLNGHFVTTAGLESRKDKFAKLANSSINLKDNSRLCYYRKLKPWMKNNTLITPSMAREINSKMIIIYLWLNLPTPLN